MFRNRDVMVFVLLLAAVSPLHAQGSSKGNAAATPPAIEKKVDELFAAWNKADTPGGALAVVRDGKIIYSQGYGMADVEHAVRNTPATVFHVASVSKQFTAFAIHLLAQDGKLSLDDDIRKYLPELHDFGYTISIRHLLHHTSGLRDQWNLLALGGWRLEDVITEQDILNMLWRQRQLNFRPGDEELYSNTGYTLLGLIVKRVAGQTLPEFTAARMFQPLGMQHTHFHDDYGSLVKDRAYSYGPRQGGGYRYIALSYSNVGATSLFTTVEDLARWDQNFYDARVGGPHVLEQMHDKGKLNSGAQIAYATGLAIGEYRGLRTVEHGGADAGYRSEILRFPERHFSVIVLGNAAEMNPAGLTRKVADLYLEGQFPLADAPAAQQRTEVPVDTKLLDAYVGDYGLKPGSMLSVTRDGIGLAAQLTGQPKFALFAQSPTEFFLKVVDAQLTFYVPADASQAATVVLHQNGRDVPGRRVERMRVTPETLAKYAGEFYSEELHSLYTVSVGERGLVLNFPRGRLPMFATFGDAFSVAYPIQTLQYQCTAAGACNSFSIDDGRVRNLRFAKVEIKPVAAGR